MKTASLFEDRLAARLRRSRLPKHPEFAFAVGLEFVRAATDGRQPATWAAAAVKPRTTTWKGKAG